MYASAIARQVMPVDPDYPGGQLIGLFERDPDLHLVAVVAAGRPIGLITRHSLLHFFSQKFGRELWDKRPIAQLMQSSPRTISIDTPIDELCRMIAGMPPDVLLEGVVFVDQDGCYAGVASAFDLYRASVQVAEDKNSRLIAVSRQLSTETEKANAASRAKSDFLATMSHEIRTPLNGVLGMAQALAMDDLAPHQREKVDVILSSGETLTTLVNDVLDLSKIEAGKLDLSPVAASLSQVMARAVDLFGALAREKNLVLSLARDGAGSDWFLFDRVRLHQCVTNLVSNAIKFTPSGEVAVRYAILPASDGRGVMLRVHVIDSGIGMNGETLDRLFNAFMQADGSTTRRFGGTGLGLVIARRLARMMDGDITATSTPGHGSVFTLTIGMEPVSACGDDQDGVPELESPDDRAQPIRILLVDDNATNRQVARLFLASLRAEIVEATNGVEALERLEQQTFDLVLLDVHMPVMDGCEAIRRIRRADQPWRDVPVIALTADAMDGDRERFVAMGMTGYLAKPIDRRALLNMVHSVAARGASVPSAEHGPHISHTTDSDLADVMDIIAAVA